MIYSVNPLWQAFYCFYYFININNMTTNFDTITPHFTFALEFTEKIAAIRRRIDS